MKGAEMIRPLIEGLALTFRYCFSKRVTLQYPEQKWDVGPRWRGRHLLLRRRDGTLRCVACMLCATVCPAQCIKIEPAEGPENQKYPESYEIDLGTCIFCGFCVEACPKEAIIMTGHYEIAE